VTLTPFSPERLLKATVNLFLVARLHTVTRISAQASSSLSPSLIHHSAGCQAKIRDVWRTAARDLQSRHYQVGSNGARQPQSSIVVFRSSFRGCNLASILATYWIEATRELSNWSVSWGRSNHSCSSAGNISHPPDASDTSPPHLPDD
jgi:hypothetical protein